MTLILCVDDRGGLAFNSRRQSQDRAVRQHILEDAHGARLWMSPYSARQFEGQDAAHITVDEGFWTKAAPEEFCFAELQDPAPWLNRVSRLILYRWNRVYPRDLVFPLPPEGWRLTAREEFSGRSHETITKEVYTR